MEMARELAGEQRKRLVARVMRRIEEIAYPTMPPDARSALREEVLDAIGTYHDFILDVLKVSRDDIVRNEVAIDLLREVHANQNRMLQRAGR